MRMAHTLMAIADWEERKLDLEMAHLDADVEEELFIELRDGYR